MKEIKKTRMLTRNNKITSRNRGVEKAHWKHQGCYVGHENLLFPTIKNPRFLFSSCCSLRQHNEERELSRRSLMSVSTSHPPI
jgi:hypothetical protein